MKKILISFALMMFVLFVPPIMAQASIVVFETSKYMMIASTDLAIFATKVAEVLDWTGTTPGVDRFYPLGRLMISTDPATNDPLFVQHFTLFRDQSFPQALKMVSCDET